MNRPLRTGGPIGWMARHGVAPNLLMALLVVGGLIMSSQITQEVFPSYETDAVVASVALPGATPEEVETSLVLAIEQATSRIEGLARTTSTAGEGSATVILEMRNGEDRQAFYDAVAQAVGRVTTFPEDAEEPHFRFLERKRRVVELQVHGPVDPMSLRMAAERVRSGLLLDPGISQVELARVPELEIHIELDRAALRAHALTLEEVATTVRAAALDRAGGTLETDGGDLLLRLNDRRENAAAFAEIPLVAGRAGPVLRLGDVATLTHGFADATHVRTFDNTAAIAVDIFRVGDETPISISDSVRAALPGIVATLPEAVQVSFTNDNAEIYRGRLHLLLKNGAIGLVLVLLLLSLFLEYRLAFWVAVGIPTAFLGTFLILPHTGASVNMVTMFAFILALGIVVDDAIVVGENIYESMERGLARLEAAVQGARDIATPLAFSILTNIVAFLPLAMVPGWFGKFFLWIPVVVSVAFILSWIEALFVLPAHLAGVRPRDPERPPNRLMRIQRRVSGGLEWVTSRLYGPLLRVALSWRYTTVALMTAVMMVVLAFPLSGQMGFSLFPPVPRDFASARISLPVGTPQETAEAVRDRMVAAAEAVVAENGGTELSRGIGTQIANDQIDLWIHLQPPDVRPIGTGKVKELWREKVGEIPEARSARFMSSFGGPGGVTDIEVQLSHGDSEVLAAAAAALADRLRGLEAVRDVDDGATPGKPELAFRLTDAGRALGLTSREVGAQVRAAFHGVEALAQQDGRNEVSVLVRPPAAERRSEGDVERLLIRTPDGGEVPLSQIATVTRDRADGEINRTDGRRVVTVSANVDPEPQTNRVIEEMTARLLPQLQADYPGLGFRFSGRQEASRETVRSFTELSVPLTLVFMYALLAIPFRSYIQPLIVMMAIPFGIVGAVLGHMLMGMTLSMISVFGVIALSGVVINAAIVMIDYANRARASGLTAGDAIWAAGVRRFRPILLTTMTTFGGLAPMIFETSRQAKFLVPMAVSLGYGILFATLIVMVLIPALYLVVEDLKWLANPQPRDPPRRIRRTA